MLKRKLKKPPRDVDGISVVALTDRPIKIRGGLWVTLVPEDNEIDALWEFDRISGKILRTR